MSSDSPWRDALRRSSLSTAGTAALAAASAGSRAPAIEPASEAALASKASPRLAELFREREALEGQMKSLLAAPTPEARYVVESLATRRAAFARWSSARDQRREQSALAAESLPAPVARVSRPGDPQPALRPTPGEVVPAGRVPVDPVMWMLQRDRNSPRPRAAAYDEAGLPNAGRALRDFGVEPRKNGAGLNNGSGDALERLWERSRQRLVDSRLTRSGPAQALKKARKAIPDGWEERLRSRIPGLGRADPYVRDTLRKLMVEVGSLEEIGDKSERLRETALTVRELQRADEDGDDARRDRALERLKARRAEDNRDD